MKAKIMPEKKTMRTFFIMAVALGCLIVAPPLFAQDYGAEGGFDRQQQQQYDQQQQYQHQQPAQQEIDVSDETLEQFAEAHVQIEEIRQDYSAEVRQTQDPEKAQQLQNKYQTKMVDAIHSAGLDVNQYNEIVHAMERDPEIREKVMNY